MMNTKDVGIAYLFLLLFGLFGGHKFYMGKVGLGILYILLLVTGITFLLCIIDLFILAGQVRNHNILAKKLN